MTRLIVVSKRGIFVLSFLLPEKEDNENTVCKNEFIEYGLDVNMSFFNRPGVAVAVLKTPLSLIK